MLKSPPKEIAQARPKTFRRPVGLEDKAQETIGLVSSKEAVSYNVVAHDESSHPAGKNKSSHSVASTSDKHFGAILIVLLVLVNVLIAVVFSAIKPVTTEEKSVEVFHYKSGTAAEVNVYSTPVPIRRTATYLSLDSAADSTDTMIKQMPAPPPSVEFE